MAKIDGNDGRNTLYGTNLRDIMDGRGGDDAVFGRGGDDLIYGRGGNDRLYGERGIDYISGGDGNDVLFGQEDRDRLWGDSGDDLVHGGTGNDELFGGGGQDNLKGNDGNDTLWGDYGVDRLDGGGGNDRLFLGAGGGRILGGGGDDLLVSTNTTDGPTILIDGGAGRDTFQYLFNSEGPTDSPYGGLMNVKDMITDFQSGQDKLDMTEVIETSEETTFTRLTFADLDTNQDGVFNGQDEAGSIGKASFWGKAVDSLVLHLEMTPIGSTAFGTVTLYSVTELRAGDIA